MDRTLTAEDIQLVEYVSDPINFVKLQGALDFMELEDQLGHFSVYDVRPCNSEERLSHPNAIAMAKCCNPVVWLPVFVGQWPECDKVIRDLMDN